MFNIEDIGLTEQCFTHVFEGQATMIAIERLLKDPDYLALEVVLTPVEEQFARYCMEHRGIEQRRLDRLGPEQLTQPICYLEFPRADMGGMIVHLMADGNHRYVKASMLGFKELPGRIVPQAIWRKYQIAVPLAIAEMFIANESGVP